jgi:hypothetical protein
MPAILSYKYYIVNLRLADHFCQRHENIKPKNS